MTIDEAKILLCQMYLPQFDEEEKQALTIAIQALEEIQQYRAIGTVEETQKKMEELERWHTDRINENIKNPFAYTSTLICHNCDHKDEYIEELESEVAEYKTIGTIEEFNALKEKSVAKKAEWKFDDFTAKFGNPYHCSNCDEEFGDIYNYCPNCGCDMYAD